MKPIIDNPILNDYVKSAFYWQCCQKYARARKIDINQARKETEELMILCLNSTLDCDDHAIMLMKKLWNGKVNTCLCCGQKFIVPFHELRMREYDPYCLGCSSGLPQEMQITTSEMETVERTSMAIVGGIVLFILIMFSLLLT